MNYRYVSSSKLKTILDDNSDNNNSQYMRSVLIDRYMRQNKIRTLSIAKVKDEYGGDTDDDQEASFRSSGCDCCSHGLGNDVYDVIGYSKRLKKVIDVGQVCHECLCIEANGIDR